MCSSTFEPAAGLDVFFLDDPSLSELSGGETDVGTTTTSQGTNVLLPRVPTPLDMHSEGAGNVRLLSWRRALQNSKLLNGSLTPNLNFYLWRLPPGDCDSRFDT
jgi:hypothetical protein